VLTETNPSQQQHENYTLKMVTHMTVPPLTSVGVMTLERRRPNGGMPPTPPPPPPPLLLLTAKPPEGCACDAADGCRGGGAVSISRSVMSCVGSGGAAAAVSCVHRGAASACAHQCLCRQWTDRVAGRMRCFRGCLSCSL
jgi:hypothetical protein